MIDHVSKSDVDRIVCKIDTYVTHNTEHIRSIYDRYFHGQHVSMQFAYRNDFDFHRKDGLSLLSYATK